MNNPSERPGTVTIPDWLSLRFPGDLIEIMQRIARILVEEKGDGQWDKTPQAFDVMVAVIKAEWALNPETKDDPLPPEKAAKDAKVLLDKTVRAYQAYVEQPLDKSELGLLWVP